MKRLVLWAIALALMSTVPALAQWGGDRRAVATIKPTETVTLTGVSTAGSVLIQISGTWTPGTLYVESTLNGSTWVGIPVQKPDGTSVANITLNGLYTASLSGLAQIRVRSDAATTDAAVVAMSATVSSALAPPATIAGGTIGVTQSTSPWSVSEIGTTPTFGTLTQDGTADAIGSSLAVSYCLVQNDPDNTVDLLVGDSGSQPIQLSPGQSIGLHVTNRSVLYTKTVSGTGTVSYVCR